MVLLVELIALTSDELVGLALTHRVAENTQGMRCDSKHLLDSDFCIFLYASRPLWEGGS